MIDWAELTLFLYITARITGCMLFNPILGRRGIPAIFRSGFILMLSLFAYSISGQRTEVPSGILEMGLRMLLELSVGFFLGMVVNFFFYIPQLTGSVVDTQMGMTMNQTYDPGAQANMSVTGSQLNVLMTMLFFAGYGHHTLLRIILTSGRIVAFGSVSLGPQVYRAMLELFVECSVLGIKLCMPILAAELIAQLGMGILMKVIPQINVFAINLELKIIIGLALLFLLMIPFGEFLLQAEITMLDRLSELLALMG